MLLSYFNLCQASRPGEVGARLRRAIVAGECIPPRYAALSTREGEKERKIELPSPYRGNIGGKMIARLLLLVLFLRVPFIAYQFSLLFPYAHLTRPLVPVRCLGQFLFRSRADGSNSRASRLPHTGKTTRAHLTFINKTLRSARKINFDAFPSFSFAHLPFFFYFPLLSIYYFLSFFFSLFGTYFSVRI